jgi:hypothetical protein
MPKGSSAAAVVDLARRKRGGEAAVDVEVHAVDVTRGRATLGDTNTEALRALKRRLSDIVYRALLADAHASQTACLDEAA